MKSLPIFLIISFVISIYVLSIIGLVYLYFSVFGENLLLLVLLLIIFSVLLNFIANRFDIESKIHIWKEAFQRTTFPLTVVCMLGAVALPYLSLQSYSMLISAIFFLILAVLLFSYVFFSFKSVFLAYGFKVLESKKTKQREVI